MKYRDVSFIATLAFVVCGLQLLARVNRPPEIPRDSSHSVFGYNARDQCLRCHRRTAQSETDVLDPPHKQPKRWRADKTDCLLCHRNVVR